MRRREFIAQVSCAAVATAYIYSPFIASGIAAVHRPVIGVLTVNGRAAFAPRKESFVQGLQQAGYSLGRDIDLVERYAEGQVDQLPTLADELSRFKPEVILAGESSSALAIEHSITNIPIVVGGLADPVRLGLIASEARPGGNVTGILLNLDGLPGKQLQFAAELAPTATHIGFLFNGSNPGMMFQLPEIEEAASRLGLKLVTVKVKSIDDLEASFKTLSSADVGSVLVGQDATFLTEAARIGTLAAAARLPWVSGHDYAHAGAVIGYGVVISENFRRAASFVDRILKGAKPADLPVEFPTKVELILNLKSAKALGLTIPSTLRAVADEVIE